MTVQSGYDRFGAAFERVGAEPLANTCLLSFLMASSIPVCALLLATVIRYRLSRRSSLWWALALCFFPFALGPSVFAYAVATVVRTLELGQFCSGLSDWGKLWALAMLLVVRLLPLGVFFFLVSPSALAPAAAEYSRTNGLPLTSQLRHVCASVSSATLVGFSIFAGAVASTEVALPHYLFRANPGTGGETAGLALSRLYRELSSEDPSAAAMRAGVVGLSLGLLALVAGIAGALAGLSAVRGAERTLRGSLKHHFARTVSAMAKATILLAVACTILGLGVALFTCVEMLQSQTWAPSMKAGLVDLLVLISAAALAVVLAGVSLPLLGRQRLIRAAHVSLGTNLLKAGALFFPLFVPAKVYSLAAQPIAVSEAATRFGMCALALGFVAINLPVMLHIFSTLFSALPRSWLEWEHASAMRASFTIWVDGFVQFKAAVFGLGVMCLAFMATDGALAPAFDNVVPSFEATLESAVFGRAGDAAAAFLLAAAAAVAAWVAASAVATVGCEMQTNLAGAS